MVAVPKRPRPHQPEREQKEQRESLKQQLIQYVVRGDVKSAQDIRSRLELESAQKSLEEEMRLEKTLSDASFALWTVDGEVVERTILSATPEARKLFPASPDKEAEEDSA